MEKERTFGAVSGFVEQMRDGFLRDGSAKLKLSQEEVPQVMGELIGMVKDGGSKMVNMVINKAMKAELVKNLINNPNRELFSLLEEQGIRPESIGLQLTRQGMEISFEGREQEVTKDNYQQVLMGRMGGVDGADGGN